MIISDVISGDKEVYILDVSHNKNGNENVSWVLNEIIDINPSFSSCTIPIYEDRCMYFVFTAFFYRIS